MGHYSKQIEEHYATEEETFGKPHTVGAPSGYVQEQLHLYRPLKESDGKAEDARYCFLADIADVVNPQYSGLGDSLSILVRAVEHNDKSEALKYTSDVIRELRSDTLMNDLIGVRAQALNSGKYTFESYREPIDVNLLLDAAARHFLKILFVGDLDEESGFPHTAHIAANIIMIHTQLNK